MATLPGTGNSCCLQKTFRMGDYIEKIKAPSCRLEMHSKALIGGLNVLRQSDKLLDVTLIVEDQIFKAHRVVLAACSDYFCAMFSDPMRESRQAEIQLKGVSARGIKLLIEYAYTSNLPLDHSNIEDVLSVSTHVQMKAVIDECSSFLESKIDLENCFTIASLAELYSLYKLKRKTYRFICSRFADLAKTADMKNLNWEQFESLLSCNYPVDCKEKMILQYVLDYCTSTKLSLDRVRRLLAKIRFDQIPPEEWKQTGGNWIGDPISLQLMQQERMTQIDEKHKKKLIQLNCHNVGDSGSGDVDNDYDDDDGDELISPQVLINSRGMELALVKIGGFEHNGLTNQLSCYLPSKKKWRDLTMIPHIEQCNYGTAVLCNDLFVVGGSYDVCLKEYIHPFGFRYSATTNRWKSIAPVQHDRCRFSLNGLGDSFLYAVGGDCEMSDYDDDVPLQYPISNCERYNVKLDRWEYASPLPENRSQHAGAIHGKYLYVSGGIDRNIVLSSLWRLNTEKDKWIRKCSMPTARADHFLIPYGNFIYACGGWYEDVRNETRVLVETIDAYDINANRWTVETRNPMPKYYTGVAAIKSKIYFIGGLLSTETINRTTSEVQCYDLKTKKWIENESMDYPKEVWECTCAAFYVPRVSDDMDDD